LQVYSLNDDFADAISSLRGFAQYFLKSQRIFTLCEGAVLVDFVVYVLSGGDIPTCITETSTFMANELLRWALVDPNVAVSLLLSAAD